MNIFILFHLFKATTYFVPSFGPPSGQK